jgi:DNA-directed RNA polymerase
MNRSDKSIPFKSRLILRYDSTCSGLQHMAALLRDKELATLVNLGNADSNSIPKYIYTFIADRCKDYIAQYKDALSPN